MRFLPRFRRAVLLAFAACAPLLPACGSGEGAVPSQPEVDQMCEQVAKIRGAAFSSKVSVDSQGNEDFRAFVLNTFDEDYPGGQAAARSRAFARLGLIPEGCDLREAILSLTLVEAVAYYDPKAKTCHIVKGDVSTFARAQAFSHELAHALQDQRFDLKAFVEASKLTEDEIFARRCVAEGDATIIGTLCFYAQKGLDVPPDAEEHIGKPVADMFRRLRESDFLMAPLATKDVKELAAAAKGLEARDRAVAAVPVFLRRMLIEPYFEGTALVQAAYRKGKWERVDALFKAPPRSSEQVLHPEKVLGPKPDEPVPVPLEGEKEADDAGTVGEFGAECLLEEGLRAGGKKQAEARAAAEKAAAGWGGDRYVLDKDGVLKWLTVWDTEDDAKEFKNALAEALKPRFKEVGDRFLETTATFGPGGEFNPAGMKPAAEGIGFLSIKEGLAAAIHWKGNAVAFVVGPGKEPAPLWKTAVDLVGKPHVKEKPK